MYQEIMEHDCKLILIVLRDYESSIELFVREESLEVFVR